MVRPFKCFYCVLYHEWSWGGKKERENESKNQSNDELPPWRFIHRVTCSKLVPLGRLSGISSRRIDRWHDVFAWNAPERFYFSLHHRNLVLTLFLYISFLLLTYRVFVPRLSRRVLAQLWKSITRVWRWTFTPTSVLLMRLPFFHPSVCATRLLVTQRTWCAELTRDLSEVFL